jgi:hypothetical protein
LATKIDPRGKTVELLDATLTASDFLEMEVESLDKEGPITETLADKPRGHPSAFMEKIFGTRSTPRKNEVDQYLAMEAIGPYDDPLKWWAARSNTIPTVARLARKYLAIPAKCVPSERLFADSGHVMNKRRTRLSAQMFGKIVFCQNNYKRYGTMFPDAESDSDSEEADDDDEYE